MHTVYDGASDAVRVQNSELRSRGRMKRPEQQREVGREVVMHRSGAVWIEPDRIVHRILQALLTVRYRLVVSMETCPRRN